MLGSHARRQVEQENQQESNSLQLSHKLAFEASIAAGKDRLSR